MSASYDHADKLESSIAENEEQSHLARLRTKGGHPDDRSQPALPIVHRSFANPAPLGLLSFATGKSTTAWTSSERYLTIISRYFLDFSLWRPRPQHPYTECPRRNDHLLRRGECTFEKSWLL
jgi:hypothetical protein